MYKIRENIFMERNVFLRPEWKVKINEKIKVQILLNYLATGFIKNLLKKIIIEKLVATEFIYSYISI